MIDFSTLKGLTIPEGNVTKIEDAQGNVLWSAVKPVPVITTSTAGYSSNYVDYAYIEFVDVKGNTYKVDSQGGAIDIEASMAAGAPVWTNTFEIPVGTVITCYVESTTDKVKSYVSVNGTKVVNKADDDMTYDYTVVGNANIVLYTYGSSKSEIYGYIKITET